MVSDPFIREKQMAVSFVRVEFTEPLGFKQFFYIPIDFFRIQGFT